MINNPNLGLSPYDGTYFDPFQRCTELIALAQPFNMTVVEYLRHLLVLKEERICFRVVLLTCLEVYQKMKEAESAARESKRTKGAERSSNGSGNVRSIEITAEMKEGLPPQMLAIINMLESKIEVLNSKNGVLTSKNEASDCKNGVLTSKYLRRRIRS